ncbi:hypothetical protein MRX96_030243 [Rhipicephalus microplus]
MAGWARVMQPVVAAAAKVKAIWVSGTTAAPVAGFGARRRKWAALRFHGRRPSSGEAAVLPRIIRVRIFTPKAEVSPPLSTPRRARGCRNCAMRRPPLDVNANLTPRSYLPSVILGSDRSILFVGLACGKTCRENVTGIIHCALHHEAVHRSVMTAKQS